MVEAPLLALNGGAGQSPLVLHFADGSKETRTALFLSTPVRIASRIPEELGGEFGGWRRARSGLSILEWSSCGSLGRAHQVDGGATISARTRR